MKPNSWALVGGVDDDLLYGAAGGGDGRENADKAGEGRGEGIARRVAEDDELEEAIGVGREARAWHTVVEGLEAGREGSVRFAGTQRVGEFPTVGKGS